MWFQPFCVDLFDVNQSVKPRIADLEELTETVCSQVGTGTTTGDWKLENGDCCSIQSPRRKEPNPGMKTRVDS